MRLISNSEEETRQIGYRLGKRLKRGDVVCLYGGLGAGKTTMLKGIATAIGIDEREITSASFVIIAEHRGRIPLYHIDLYRVSAKDIYELGLHEYINKDGITVIEWADRAEGELPEYRIDVRIDYEDEGRRVIDIDIEV
ncbi:MAG: tRNA (adenosine(37)-N6)-threonylcarbamoyltransferase complex ATPase subunit type 1 TsaE [Thermodesulfovibrionia bacterium]